MKVMLDVFFKDMPSIVFEPVFVLGVCGLITVLIKFRKERSVFYWTTLFSLIFMVAWRVLIQIVSSRYAEILIIPMSVAAAYFCFEAGKMLPEKFRKMETLSKFLPGLLFSAVVLICIIKVLNFNQYTAMKSCALKVKNDDAPGKHLVYTLKEYRANQICYYSGKEVPLIKSIPDNLDRNPAPGVTAAVIADAKAKAAGTVYLFVETLSGEVPLSALPENRGWELFASGYFNRKHKRILRVYRYKMPSGEVQ